MPLPRALLALAIASVVSLALSFGISAAQDFGGEEGPSGLEIDWAYRPDDLADLVSETPAIVVAEVESVRAGDELVLSPAADGEPAHTLATSLIDVQVTDAIDGETPSEFTLYQLGGQGLHAEDDPPYRPGERYLLFVEPRDDGTWLVTAPDGRLEKVSGELQSQTDGAVAAELDGATVSQAEDLITDGGEQ